MNYKTQIKSNYWPLESHSKRPKFYKDSRNLDQLNIGKVLRIFRITNRSKYDFKLM